MRAHLYKLLNDLKNNSNNTITYYQNNKKIQKTFAEFSRNIDDYLNRFNYLKSQKPIKSIAIIGPVSYEWAVCDYACIKGGFLSVAIPETLPNSQVLNIIKETQSDLVLIDDSIKERYTFENVDFYYIKSSNLDEKFNFLSLKMLKPGNDENLILKEYSIVFSSGTSEKLKYIKKTFNDIESEKQTSIKKIFNKIIRFYYIFKYKRSFWSNPEKKIIIFMPFSHPQQRDFFRMAISSKINIVLSDTQNCLKHIIIEKPNIMISVPIVYEAMANRIKLKIERFNRNEKRLFKLFNTLRINRLSNNSIIKRRISAILFKDIKKIYGGKGDFFVTGSAHINPEVIKIFYSIGVKILEAYGQSEVGTISMNTPSKFKIGSVGKPTFKVKISDESEVLVKYDQKQNEFNKDILNIDADEYIHTGDIGYLDKQGFLFITGRKDDVIVLESGKKIFPNKIEEYLNKNSLINDSLVVSYDGYKICAIICCIGNTSILAIEQIISDINLKLLNHEKIHKYLISKELFSVENGLLTPTYKKVRKKIKEYYLNQKFIKVE